MISIIITTFQEPQTIQKAIDSFILQNIKEPYELIVVAPDKETENIVKSHKDVRIRFLKDKGIGKSNAINLALNKAKGNILILSDGDVYVSKNSVDQILNLFENKDIGCVSGRPVSISDKGNIIGFWSHFLVDVGAHEISRKRRFLQNKFLECSGYLFAFRSGIIDKIPTDVAEDTIIPYYFYKKGYRIGYAENALVYVKYPTKLKEFIRQRVRTAKAHETLKKYAPDLPRVKSLKNEFLEGLKNLKLIFSYPDNFKELFWLLFLFPVRLNIWLKVHFQHSIKKKQYKDAWEKVKVD